MQPATLANRAQLHSSASCLCAVAGVHLGSCAAGGWCSCWQLIDSSLPDIQDGACSWGCHLHNFFVIQTLEVDRTPCFSVSPAGCVDPVCALSVSLRHDVIYANYTCLSWSTWLPSTVKIESKSCSDTETLLKVFAATVCERLTGRSPEERFARKHPLEAISTPDLFRSQTSLL